MVNIFFGAVVVAFEYHLKSCHVEFTGFMFSSLNNLCRVSHYSLMCSDILVS